MKISNYRIVCMVCSAWLAFSTPILATAAATDEELFTQANELYKKGSFAQAYETYQKISTKSSAANYNLGNCAYKLSKFGYALLYWRRAERDWGFFGREELNKNIELVKKQVLQQQQPAAEEQTGLSILLDFCKKQKNSFISAARSIQLFHLQIIVLTLWIILFCYLRYLYKRRQKAIIFTLFSLLTVFVFMLVIKYNSQLREYAIVVNLQSSLLSGPGSTFTLLERLPEAQELVILKESGDYYKIRVNGRIGWITKSSVEKI